MKCGAVVVGADWLVGSGWGGVWGCSVVGAMECGAG